MMINNNIDECVICLEDLSGNEYLSFPNEYSNCECKYNVHNVCLENYKMNCLICNAQINNFHNIQNDRQTIKKWYKTTIFKFFIFFFIILILILITSAVFY